MKPVIIVAGMLGAGCTSVAFELSKLTGFEVVNSERIIREVVSEKGASYAMFAEMVRDGEVDLEGLIRNVAIDYVEEGNVIVEGRTAFLVLDRPAILKVFLYADRRARAERVAKRRGVSLAEAEREVEVSDEDRNRLVERLYRKPFTDPSLYDAVINTTGLSYEAVAQLLNEMLRWKQRVSKA